MVVAEHLPKVIEQVLPVTYPHVDLSSRRPTMERFQRLVAKAAPKLTSRSPVDLEAVEAAMTPVPQFCEVVTAHLSDVVDQTDTAARAIIEQLATVDSLAEAMAGDVGDLIQTLSHAETELTGVSTSTNHLVYRLVNYFIERDRQVRHLVAEIRALDRHVTAIEDVVRETNSVALSSMVAAVKAGEAGKGFAAQAQEVRKLADRSAAAARDIGSSIAALTGEMDGVLADELGFEQASLELNLSDADKTPMTRRLAEIVQAQNELATMMKATLQHTVRAARQVSLSSDSVAANTTGAVGHIQFQDISRQMIEHASAAVVDVQSLAENVLGYTTGTVKAGELKDRHIDADKLRRSHVMARQRSTHAAAIGDDSYVDNELAIELF
jgi:methyl-accepting chemotaxis protein